MYEILTTVRVYADNRNEAYGYVRHALEHSKKADIECLDSEVIREWEEDEAEEVAEG